MTWALTLDFHNTIAQCDEWFQFEVKDLIDAFFKWRDNETATSVDPTLVLRGTQKYREIRRRVMHTGIEVDAACAVAEVLDFIDEHESQEVIETALKDIFEPTLATTKPMDGIISAVQRLAMNEIPIAVVSSAAYHPFLEWTLQKFEVDECFVAIVSSAVCGHYKSTPRIYEAALSLLNVDPCNCIHVGDSERFDILPAKSLGIRTVLYDPLQKTVHTTDAEAILSDLSQLPGLLVERFGMPIEI